MCTEIWQWFQVWRVDGQSLVASMIVIYVNQYMLHTFHSCVDKAVPVARQVL
jgi:hypothetical protein